MSAFALAMLLLVGIAPISSAEAVSSRGSLHPQDGPHVDVRLIITDEEVRVRLEMNLVFLDEMIDFPRETSERVSTVEWVDLRPALESFFSSAHPVSIDGTVVEPTLEKLQINDPDLRLLPLFPVSGERGLRKIRFELVYAVSSPPPSQVSFEWSTFPPNILVDPEDPPPLVIAAELDAEGIRTPVTFNTIERGHTWHATGADVESRLLVVPSPVTDLGTEVPVLAIALFVIGGIVILVGILLSRSTGSGVPIAVASLIEGPLIVGGVLALIHKVGMMTMGGGLQPPDRAEAEEIFKPLHANVYRAFDFIEEEDIYDALSRSVDGAFLDDLYRTIFRSLVMQEEGGAVARISDVRPIEIEVGESGVVDGGESGAMPAFNVRCRWQVEGVVSHWGHAHTRVNEYLADWSVALTDGGWRLTGSEILEQDRIEDSSTDPLDGMGLDEHGEL
ncbi:MAG: hypothetical protein CMJ34_05560 [Phycisphaerae bacterium]|nr:hypothetical protein [Phycisphaerae bacterium]